MRRGAGLALVALLLAACGTTAEPAPGGPDAVAEAPTFTVQGDREPLTLKAYTHCGPGYCADGAPPDPLPSAGRPAAVPVRFSEPGWTLTASAHLGEDDDCARTYDLPVTGTGDGDWVLQPAGPAGTYDVTLSARGTRGDAYAAFAWTMPVRGTMPAPAADLVTDSLELSVRNLARTPKIARATVTVAAADGRVTTIQPEAPPLAEGAEACAAEGRVVLYAPQSDRLELGPEPLRYVVRLELDGTTYRAEAIAPDDVEQREGHPRVRLTFDPPLPAYTG